MIIIIARRIIAERIAAEKSYAYQAIAIFPIAIQGDRRMREMYVRTKTVVKRSRIQLKTCSTHLYTY